MIGPKMWMLVNFIKLDKKKQIFYYLFCLHIEKWKKILLEINRIIFLNVNTFEILKVIKIMRLR